jgi:glycosyltransferase involved in cell wall biosynthesis
MMHRFGLRAAFARAKAVVAISPATFDALLPYVPRHALHLIPWGVPQGFLDGGAIEPKSPPEVDGHKYMTILYDPFPHKRLDLLENVVALLDEFGWDLVVMGSLRGSGAPIDHPRVHYLGFVPEEDLPRYMKGSSLHLHTSEYEGFGHPPYEAMSLRVPVLYNRRCAALRDLMGDKAHTFDGDNDLEPRLYDLMECDETRTQHVDEAREWVRTWDWETTAALYIDLFRRGAQ